MYDCFVTLECALRNRGLVEDARWLNEVNSCAYTTSSEMYGEIGAMLKRIHRSIPLDAISALENEFGECERFVRQVWPEFRLDPPTS